MNNSRKIYFHIGAHKTASSFLFSNLRAHKNRLSQQGLDCIFRREILSSVFGRELADVVGGLHPSTLISAEVRDWIDVVTGKNSNHVLFANEDLVCSLNVRDFYQKISASMEYIDSAFSGFEVHVILYVRNQVDWLESVYMQHVHLGRQMTFSQFQKLSQDTDYSWLRVLDDISRVVSKERLFVRVFESIKTLKPEGFWADYLSTCGISNVSDLPIVDEGGRKANRSYGEIAMKIALFANPLLQKSEKRLLRQFLQENFSTATHSRAQLYAEREKLELFSQYASTNREMFSRYDLDSESYGEMYF